MKRLKAIYRPEGSHWVGDGFPVRTLFSYAGHPEDVSPFLLFDHAGPKSFGPTDVPRGVDEHPHRGFETVTIVYQGELQHRDSAGHAGKIGPGDVQWMTAASGVVHEEMHSDEFARQGGVFEVVQLWVNLPARNKMDDPRYQEIRRDDVPTVRVRGGDVRVIAGDFAGTLGPAQTVTPIEVWDVRFEGPGILELPVPRGHNAVLAVLDGSVEIEHETVGAHEVGVFGPEGSGVAVKVLRPGKALLLAGEPIQEPVAGYGPFVMNTQDEIRQAVEDFRSGRLGKLLAG
ncbi:MAG: pirin family protein [Armatimonadetes bacterium]|nr:pirin family protein [Armatimonadota bacterium]